MTETTNNPKFFAGYVVRTSRSKPAMGSNDYRSCRLSSFNSSPDERNLFQFFIGPKLCIEFDTTHLAG